MKRSLSDRFGSLQKNKSTFQDRFPVDNKILKTWEASQRDEKWSNSSELHEELMEREERQLEVSESCDVRRFQKLKVNLRVNNVSNWNNGNRRNSGQERKEIYNPNMAENLHTNSSLRGMEIGPERKTNKTRYGDSYFGQDNHWQEEDRYYEKINKLPDWRSQTKEKNWRCRSDTGSDFHYNNDGKHRQDSCTGRKSPRIPIKCNPQKFDNYRRICGEDLSYKKFRAVETDGMYDKNYSKINERKTYPTDNQISTPHVSSSCESPGYVEEITSMAIQKREISCSSVPVKYNDSLCYSYSNDQSFDYCRPPDHFPNTVCEPYNSFVNAGLDGVCNGGTDSYSCYDKNISVLPNNRNEDWQTKGNFEHVIPTQIKSVPNEYTSSSHFQPYQTITRNDCSNNFLENSDLNTGFERNDSLHYVSPGITRPPTFYNDRLEEREKEYTEKDKGILHSKDGSSQNHEKEVLVTSFLEQCQKLVVNDSDQRAVEKVFQILKSEMKQNIEPNMKSVVQDVCQSNDSLKIIDAKFSPVVCSPDSCHDGSASAMKFEGRTLLKGGVKPRHIPKTLIIKPNQQPPSDPRIYDGYCLHIIKDLHLPSWSCETIKKSEKTRQSKVQMCNGTSHNLDNIIVIDMEIEEDENIVKCSSEVAEENVNHKDSKSKMKIENAIIINNSDNSGQLERIEIIKSNDKPTDPRLQSLKCKTIAKDELFTRQLTSSKGTHISPQMINSVSFIGNKESNVQNSVAFNNNTTKTIVRGQDCNIDPISVFRNMQMNEKNKDSDLRNRYKSSESSERTGFSSRRLTDVDFRDKGDGGVKNVNKGVSGRSISVISQNNRKNSDSPRYREMKKANQHCRSSPPLAYRDRHDRTKDRNRETSQRLSDKSKSRFDRWS